MTSVATQKPFTPEQEKALQSWTREYPYPIMGILEALRQVQQWNLCVRPEHEDYVADLFKTTRTRVHELVTFFPMFTQKPTGRQRIGICHGLSCAMSGADKACASLSKKLGVSEGETTKDGEHSWEELECIGACEQAPAFQINDELQGPATPEALEKLAGSRRPVLCAGEKQVLTKDFVDSELHTLEAYLKHGGYEGWKKAQTMSPAELSAEVQKSNLRGLGGAGFPTGGKWGTVPPVDKAPERYVVGNYDESEPGCFKDRVLGERAPHQILEGLLIACSAVSSQWGFIFIRGEYAAQDRILRKAIAEVEAAGLNAGIKLRLMRGAGAYICGLDTALLETMEGKKAWPRQPPPFPTVVGLMGKPTVVNNVETLSMLPHIIKNGGEWFARIGVPPNPEKKIPGSGGTAVFSVSGDIEKPGIYEVPLGTPVRKVIEMAGGVKGGKSVKCVIPGGTSAPPLSAAEIDTPLDFDSIRTVGSFLGACGIIVMDETRDMVEVAHNIERFLAHESCGQCTPCREGSEWTTRILERALEGKGVSSDVPNLQRIGENITGKVICALGDTVGMVTRGFMKKFPDDFKKRIPS
jgi:NADH-quinone oxidoreductase subunit F